jgi:LysM repeat protein
MKSLPSALRLLALPALALLGVSCGSKDEVAANPYASNPYYGPQTYGKASQGSTASTNDGGYVAPAPAPVAPVPAPVDYGYVAPAPAPAPSYGSTAGGGTHTVTSGDTLFSLSRRYGTTVPAIKSANGLNSDLIRIGQTLTIPSV